VRFGSREEAIIDSQMNLQRFRLEPHPPRASRPGGLGIRSSPITPE
jgi:hypothetical protein